MDELDQDFLNEVMNMRLEITYKKKLKTRSRVAAEKKLARDDRIDELYNFLEKECTEKGRKLLLKYTDELAYRESDDADFYYKSGFLDGVALIMQLQRIENDYLLSSRRFWKGDFQSNTCIGMLFER